MRSRSVNLINLIKNQCDFVMQDKKDLPKSLSNLALTYYLVQSIEDRSNLHSYIALLSFYLFQRTQSIDLLCFASFGTGKSSSSTRFCLVRGGTQLSLVHPLYALHRSDKSSICSHCVGKSFARHLPSLVRNQRFLNTPKKVLSSKGSNSIDLLQSRGPTFYALRPDITDITKLCLLCLEQVAHSYIAPLCSLRTPADSIESRLGRFLGKHTKLPPSMHPLDAPALIRSNSQRRTSYLVLLLVKIVAFTKKHRLRTNKKNREIFLQSIEYKYTLPLRQFLALEGALKQTTNELVDFCYNSKNNQKNDKSLLITFSGGQDSVTLLVLLFGIQSQNLLKLNILWNNHLWHKDSFFITRHVLKLSFLFKISTHSAIAIRPVKTELQARQWRLKVSRRLNSFYKYQSVIQAHSGTDKIETLLLNLFRGTGNTSPFHSTDFSLNSSQAQKRKLLFK